MAKKVLDALLDKYADQGIKHIEGFNILTIQPLSTIGTPKEIVDAFGGKDNYINAVHELEQELYRISA